MSTPPADDDPHDRRTAIGTRFVGARVDAPPLVIVALVPVGVAIVGEGCAATLDRIGEQFADRAVEDSSTGRRHSGGNRQWMESGAEQGLVGINIPQPGDECLIEEERLQACAAWLASAAAASASLR